VLTFAGWMSGPTHRPSAVGAVHPTRVMFIRSSTPSVVIRTGTLIFPIHVFFLLRPPARPAQTAIHEWVASGNGFSIAPATGTQLATLADTGSAFASPDQPAARMVDRVTMLVTLIYTQWSVLPWISC